MALNNLDAEKKGVRVIVFDENNEFVTEYEESVHTFGLAGGTEGDAKTINEIKSKLKLSGYAKPGYTLVAVGDALKKPVIYRREQTQ